MKAVHEEVEIAGGSPITHRFPTTPNREGFMNGARIPRRWVALAAAVVLPACGGDGGGGWAGSVTDSAGIVVVHNPEEGVWEGEEAPEVTRDLLIGAAEGQPEYQFGRIVGLDVDEEGSVYVLDQQAREVRVFDSAGAYIRTIGRPGNGPGELSQGTAGLMLGPGDTVLVPDGALQRVTRFTREGSEAGSFPLSFAEGIPIRWASTPEHQLVQQTRRMAFPGQPQAPEEPQPDLLLVRGADGTVRDTLMQLQTGESFQLGAGGPRIRFFAPEPVWTMTPEGKLVSGRTSDYRLEVRSRTGELERVITRPFTPKPVTEADKEMILRGMREMMRAQGAPPQAVEPMLQSASFGETYPAFANIVAGPEGSLWLQRLRTASELQEMAAGGELDMQDIGSPTWDVFDAEGRYLGSLTLPEGFSPMKVVGDRFYGVLRDELDVQYVARYRLGSGTGWTVEG